MTESYLSDIDEMIVYEKMQAALEHQNDAWAEGFADGIEPEIIADAAIVTVMRETVKLFGEDATEAMLEDLKQRLLTGEFSPERLIQ
ncbi:hypothetical protein [Hoeflea prorocentri]|uniref:Uncharacterized protein n=1 Tax=Hoeflea prorocentri TaxID=1922333 RepID=A0A9X3UII6_9HYPH|nr:hypothetical protein [Hoeflea prorocentri]MCY6381445.1 hypothetical protein [Hoeflea prorocentri]MDA5399245.1 hypothetical protein [Hoeflea prorocentri]